MKNTILLTGDAFDPAAALNALNEDAASAGGVVSFTGLVRPQSDLGEVTVLRLEAHPVLTRKGIQEAVTEAGNRWPLSAISIIHRTGDMSAREPIVFAGAASIHRRAAFEAVDFLMDYLKTRAVFWKKEIGPSSSRWIEPRAEDYSDFARWASKEEA